MRLAVPAFALAACGDNAAGSDAAADVAPRAPCAATFSGNFAESIVSTASCPMIDFGSGAELGQRLLDFSIPSQTIGGPMNVSIDLGTSIAPGTYTSETVRSWQALAVVELGASVCAYRAGSTVTPEGQFTLELDAIDPQHGTAHGRLALVMDVLAFEQSSCGTPDTENLDVRF